MTKCFHLINTSHTITKIIIIITLNYLSGRNESGATIYIVNVCINFDAFITEYSILLARIVIVK